jgi:hypothetical protein
MKLSSIVGVAGCRPLPPLHYVSTRMPRWAIYTALEEEK